MSRHKRHLPFPKAVATWTYWVSRDSIQGELAGMCHLWYRKPMRTKIGYRVTWLNADEQDPGHLGEYALEDVARWFGTERVPETDLQLMKIEWGVTEKMLKEATER